MKFKQAFLVIAFSHHVVASINTSCPDGGSGDTVSGTCDAKENHSFECNIYLAASSIPNAGFGIYTTKSIAADERVQPYPDAPAIMVTDFYEPFGNTDADWNHNDYVWDTGSESQYEAEEVSESVMTYGSLCNFHTVLKNLAPKEAEYDDSILNRYEDPGAGAISYYSGSYFVANRDIEAGEELFDDYGENWLDDREGRYTDFVPRGYDYERAGETFEKLLTKIDISTINSDKEFGMIASTVSSFLEERPSSVFPKTKKQYDDYIKLKNEMEAKNKAPVTDKDSAIIMAQVNLLPRDINWIKTNGICIEKIRPGLSTITGAGRGAISQTFIEKGEMITPAPLLNIPNSDALLTYSTTRNDEGDKIIENEEPIGHQLLLNYCFGHVDSKLLLCPQTNAILINHCSNRQEGKEICDGNTPNAKIQWASGWDPTTDDWLKKSVPGIASLTDYGVRGLSLEVVATRDIAPSEEIFIDYGENWEKAWNNHVQNWEAPDDKTYQPYANINKHDFRTTKELETNPYPSNIEMVCYEGGLTDKYTEYEEDDDDEEDDEEDDDDDDYEVVDWDAIEELAIDGKERFDCDPDDLTVFDNLLPCEIVEIKKGTDEYLVRIFLDEKKFLVDRFPKDSLLLKRKRYSTDQHLQGTFRHFIEISDDIFPEQWKTDS